jgi:hypothetical protein
MEKTDIVDVRGEIIINNIKLASKETQSCVHDSHILADNVQGKNSLLFLYRSAINYHLNVRSRLTGELTHSFDLIPEGMVGWSPRMYKKDDDTIRCMYTKNKTGVFYQDFSLSTATLSAERALQVAIKDGLGGYETPADLTFDNFLQHIANVSDIDYRDQKYASFGEVNILMEDTQQLQYVEGKYYLSCEVLADKMLNGDTGGIACAIWSTDLETWYLNNPINIGTDIDNQRDHEISITYLNGKWHALSRFNKYTAGPPSGYRHYTSDDAETWKFHDLLLSLPEPSGGIRHSICVTDLRYADPEGNNANKTSKQVAFMMYQKIPKTHAQYEHDETSHKLRTKLGLVYTDDFENWVQVADIEDRASLHYPSITIWHDRLYMCWSSGFTGTNFISSIMWSSYNLSKI